MCKSLLVFLALLLIGPAVLAQEEPSYDGKPLADWLKAMKDKNAEVRLLAVDALQHIGPKAKGVVQALGAAINDKDRDVRFVALSVLADMGQAAKDTAPAVAALAMESKDRDIRVLALQALVNMKAAKEGTPIMCKLLQHPDAETAQIALASLLKLSPDTADNFLNVLREGRASPAIIEALPRVLLSLERRRKEILPALMAELKNKNPSVRVSVAHALVEVPEAAEHCAEVLLALLRSEDSDARFSSLRPLSTMLRHTKSADVRRRIAVEVANTGLREKSTKAQYYVSGLSLLDGKEQSALLAAQKSPADQERLARLMCGRGDIRKGETDPDDAIRPFAVGRLPDEGWMERIDCFWTLAYIGLANKKTADAYVAAALREPEPVVQRLAFIFLQDSKVSAAPAVPALLAAYKRATAETRTLVGNTLKKIDPKAAAEANIK